MTITYTLDSTLARGVFSIDDYIPGTTVPGLGSSYNVQFRIDGRTIEFDPSAERLAGGTGAITLPELSGPAQLILDTPAYRAVSHGPMLELFSVDTPADRAWQYHIDNATWTLQGQPFQTAHYIPALPEPGTLALAALVLALLVLRRTARRK